ncbi:MAG TPA: Hsp70 family protein [Kofleriaceae bacterium]|nr:Hsp70 family protein [Kofleriaceae bacterium]
MRRAVGIDLGTSNSAVAVIDDDGRPRILTTPEGSTTLPSVVWFSNDGPKVGHAALRGFDESPDLTIFGAKRLLGRRFDHPEVRRLARVLPYELVAAPNGDTWIALNGGRTVAPEEVSALVLMELRAMADRFFGEAVVDAVITVPAWFDAAARQATKDAATIAGLNVRRLLSEPSAAALGYGAHRGDKRRYAVCDLGGGTFDVALVDVEDGVFEVLSTTGDAFLGGDDFDRVLVEHLARDVRRLRSYDISSDATAVDRLRVAAQRAKHALSSYEQTTIAVANLAELPSGKAIEYERNLSRQELESWTAPLLQRLIPPCQDALLRASRRRDQVDQVLLVGGMTRMMAVQETLAQVFGQLPTTVPNPDEVVAVGAALEVARLDGIIDGVLMIDVCARGIAVSIAGGACEPVIAMNAVLPTREYRALLTHADEQTRIEFDLWEGESIEPSQNRLLGRYATPELPRAAAGDVLVVLEVTIDSDGTIRLAASELISGERLMVEQLLHSGLARSEVVRLARNFNEGREILR